MKSLKFESSRVSSLKVGASWEFESLYGNPAWKFEAAATLCARELSDLPLVSREWKNGSNSSYSCTPFFHSLLTNGKVKDRWRTRRGSRSSPQARVEILRAWSLKV